MKRSEQVTDTLLRLYAVFSAADIEGLARLIAEEDEGVDPGEDDNDHRHARGRAHRQPAEIRMRVEEVRGAGHGDYVTIATSDPRVYEPQLRRVYKVLEHEDGRFFASLLDVAQGGQDIPSSPGIYKNAYTRSMQPRLVKFPATAAVTPAVSATATAHGRDRPARS